MNTLKFSENIIKLRRGKKITQEELAQFVGVTKASVSKWETGQSLPDIMLLPQLATFFDVTLDELLGYEPQLSKEQIQKIYLELSSDFTKRPFQEVMDKSRALVKKYYSCYCFLLQICILWLNHLMMETDEKKRTEILQTASDLCVHIIKNCGEIGICNDAIILKATCDLNLGKAEEIIETLEEILDPQRLSVQSDSLLVQAYQMAGKPEKANAYAQISMFLHLTFLVNGAVQYLALNSENFAVCEETINRVDALAEAYQLNRLHPNSDAVFQLQAATIYAAHNQKEAALDRLERYGADIHFLMDNNLILHGDAYFDRLHEWVEELELGGMPPRRKKLVMESVKQTLENPAFAPLAESSRFQIIKKNILKGAESYV